MAKNVIDLDDETLGFLKKFNRLNGGKGKTNESVNMALRVAKDCIDNLDLESFEQITEFTNDNR